jgi:hypothetical protein
MTKQTLRLTIINLLDDEQGINESGYKGIDELCCENGWMDITDNVNNANGRFYLGEDDADDLRAVVSVED